MEGPQDSVPWYAAYPVAKNQSPPSIERTELLQLFKNGEQVGKDFILVDLRRTDFEGGTIRGSINLPAQSLCHTIPTLYAVLNAAGVKKVIWYCGSSKGRGTRGAAWFADYIEVQGDQDMQSLVLVEGIKGWAVAGVEYTEYTVDYDSKAWEK